MQKNQYANWLTQKEKEYNCSTRSNVIESSEIETRRMSDSKLPLETNKTTMMDKVLLTKRTRIYEDKKWMKEPAKMVSPNMFKREEKTNRLLQLVIGTIAYRKKIRF